MLPPLFPSQLWSYELVHIALFGRLGVDSALGPGAGVALAQKPLREAPTFLFEYFLGIAQKSGQIFRVHLIDSID